MRVAVIDLGTNSVRFDVHDLRRTPTLLHREKLMIRLGQGVFLKGRLDDAAAARAVHALTHFKRVADDLGVSRTVAFGTSALREAQNAAEFLESVRGESGLEVKVISGSEEAKLIAAGILQNERRAKGKFLLVDIGGGSTEVSFCRGKKILASVSLRLGTARLQQVFLKGSPPRPKALEQVRAYVRNILQQQAGEWPGSAGTVIGSSGTVRALAKILRKNGLGSDKVAFRRLVDLNDRMSGMSTSELLEMPGMESKRVDMILAGSILLEELMRYFEAKEVVPTDFSLRDGILSEELALVKSQKTSLMELHLDDLVARAIRFGAEETHLRHMVNLGEVVFDRLGPLHRLPDAWKVYLKSALILRNTGEAIGISGHEKHSYYVVKNLDLPSVQGWEGEFVARLCLHHADGRVSGKDLDFLGRDGRRKEAFRKLCAILRVIDSFDLGPKTTLHLARASVTRREVVLHLKGRAAAGVETLLLDRKKKLFEEVFRRSLRVTRR